MTQLSSWMNRHGKTDNWLAEALDCDRAHAGRIRRGVNRPSPEKAVAIEKLTGGEVLAMALLVAERKREAAEARATVAKPSVVVPLKGA